MEISQRPSNSTLRKWKFRAQKMQILHSQKSEILHSKIVILRSEHSFVLKNCNSALNRLLRILQAENGNSASRKLKILCSENGNSASRKLEILQAEN